MEKIFESDFVEIEAEDSTISEKIYIYKFDDEFESEDFELLSHSEQIYELKLNKESSTPNTTSGTVNRYYIDISSSFCVVRENIITW